MSTTEKQREKWRMRKREYRARKKSERNLKENKPTRQDLYAEGVGEKQEGFNPFVDFLPKPQPKATYKRENPQEYCQKCGRHRFVCECETESKD